MQATSRASLRYFSELWAFTTILEIQPLTVCTRTLPAICAATRSINGLTTDLSVNGDSNAMHQCLQKLTNSLKSAGQCRGLRMEQWRGFASGPKRSKRVEAALQRRGKTANGLTQLNSSSGVTAVTSEDVSEQSVVAADSAASQKEIANVVGHAALVVAREIEWGTVILGFEQCNKYTVLDETGATVALLAEDVGGLGTAVGRQVLRRRRPFKATVFTPDGSRIICQIERPFYLINSSMFIKNGDGDVVGEVHQRWHLWRRKYALYIDRTQFAAIDGGLLAWEFVMRDSKGGTLALIDRNFQGFGKELFTDAGKYVVHFGSKPQEAAEQVANSIKAAHPEKPRPPVTAIAKARNDLTVIPTAAGDQLAVVRPLRISERMAVLAAAISIDFDYFSQHSSGSAGGMFPFMMPMSPTPPYPDEGGAEGAPSDASGSNSAGENVGGDSTAGTGAAGGGAGSDGFGDGTSDDSNGSWGTDGEFGSPSESGSSAGAGPGETDLGGDSWDGPGDLGGDSNNGIDSQEGGGLLSGLSDMFQDWDS